MQSIIGFILILNAAVSSDLDPDSTDLLKGIEGEVSVTGRTNMYRLGSNLNRYEIVSNLSLNAGREFEKFNVALMGNLSKELTGFRESELKDIRITFSRKIKDILVKARVTSYVGSEFYRITTTYLGTTLSGRMNFKWNIFDVGTSLIFTKNFYRYRTTGYGTPNTNMVAGIMGDISYPRENLYARIGGGINNSWNEFGRQGNPRWNYSFMLAYLLTENWTLDFSFMHDAGLYSYDGRSINTRFLSPDQMIGEFSISYQFMNFVKERLWVR